MADARSRACADFRPEAVLPYDLRPPTYDLRLAPCRSTAEYEYEYEHGYEYGG